MGAGDKAILQGKEDSAIALKHRGMSMKLVNQRLMRGDTSDASLAGIALLAGSEVSTGTHSWTLYEVNNSVTNIDNITAALWDSKII